MSRFVFDWVSDKSSKQLRLTKRGFDSDGDIFSAAKR